MIYWLCLICCIQSSYYASPLVRTKHEIHDSHTNQIDAGLRHEFQPFNFQNSAKKVRSFAERFPSINNHFKERATDQKNNDSSGYRFFIRTPNAHRKPYARRVHNQNSSKSTKYGVPKVKSYDSNVDSAFTQNPTGEEEKAKNLNTHTKSNFRDSKEKKSKAGERSQAENHENSPNLDDNQLNEKPQEYDVNDGQKAQQYDVANKHLRKTFKNDHRPFDKPRQHSQKHQKQKKHHSPGGKYGHKYVKGSNTQNEKSEPEASISNRDSMRKPMISDGSTGMGLPNHEQEDSDNHGGGSSFNEGHEQRQTGEMNRIDHNNQIDEKSPPNIGTWNKKAKMGIRHHKKSPKKKHDKKHHFAGIDTKSPEKKYTPSIFQSGEKRVNQPMLNEESNSNEDNDMLNVEDFPWQFIRPPRPDTGSMNPPETHESFFQNDNLQDQKSSDSSTVQKSNSKMFPFRGEMTNTPEGDESLNEPEVPVDEQMDEPEELRMEEPSETNGNDKQKDMQQDLPMDENNNSQNSIDSEAPENYDYNSEYGGSDLETQESEESAEESTEQYRPIHFKLRGSSQYIRSSLQDDNDTNSQRAAKEEESKNTNEEESQISKGNRDDSDKKTHFRNEKQIHSNAFNVSTTNKRSEVSPLHFTNATAQQVNNYDSTSHHYLKKKSSNAQFYNKDPMESKENNPYRSFINYPLYFPHKRSDQHMISPSSIARRNNEQEELGSNFESMSKKEFSPSDMELQVHDDISANNPNKKDLYQKRDDNIITTTTVVPERDASSNMSQKENSSNSFEPSNTSDTQTETSTSIIQEYVMPTLDVPKEIMNSIAENNKRSSSQNDSPNADNLHTDSMHFKNAKYVPLNEQNHVDERETQVRSSDDKNSDSSTPYPGQFQSDNAIGNKPTDTTISKRNEPEGKVFNEGTRTYEGLKTKQTIVKDSLTNKETNVVENQKEKIVDSIHLTKQPQMVPPSKNSGEQNESSAAEQDDEDYYLNEYENEKNENYKESAESYSEESGISGQINPQTTEEMYYDADGNFVDKKEAWYTGLSGNRPGSPLEISINKQSNTFKTDEFKKPPGSNIKDSSAAENKEKSQNLLKTSPRPMDSKPSPQPITYKSQDLNRAENFGANKMGTENLKSPNGDESQGINGARNFGANKMGGETENLESPNGDEYSDQQPIDENQYGEQSSFMDSQDNKDIPEQSSDDFIDLGEQEEKKENILEDLDKFPTTKLNTKTRGGHQSNAVPDPRGQQESQRNFYEFSTILPNVNNIGEFQREEKVERQSKTILKSNGIVTNGTSSLFGEKKMEVKDNKQNYHEAYMEEKGESKFPNEQAADSEKQKKIDNSSEASVKVRQTPERLFSRQDNEENKPHGNSNSNLLKPGKLDTDTDEKSQSTKNKKNAEYTDDDSDNEYYFATEDNPESMMDAEESADAEDYDEYVMNPRDILQNDGSIDGISKRSGALIDVSKLMKNGKSLRSSELPTVTTGKQQRDISVSTGIGFGSDPIITTTAFDGQSLKREEDSIGTSNGIAKKNVNAVTNETSELNNNEQNSIGAHMSNRQIEHNVIPNSTSGEGLNLDQEIAEALDSLVERKREDNPTEMSPRSANTGSGNIVYVTVSTTTDQESNFHDFLQIEEEGRQSRQSRQSKRHPGHIYHRQKKYSRRVKKNKFPTFYRNNRRSYYN